MSSRDTLPHYHLRIKFHVLLCFLFLAVEKGELVTYKCLLLFSIYSEVVVV